jgi:hypothetical protein
MEHLHFTVAFELVMLLHCVVTPVYTARIHVVDTLNNDFYFCMVSLSPANHHQSARLLQPLSNEQNLQEYICICKSL